MSCIRPPPAYYSVMKRLLSITCIVPVLLALCVPLLMADEAEDQFNFATGLLIKNEPEMAADEFKDLLASHPNFSKADVALYRLGEALGKTGEDAGAKKALEKLVAGYPASEKLPQGTFRLAQLTAPTDHAAAAKLYATVAGKWPDNPLAEAALYWSAEELFKAEQWAPAAKAYAAVMNKHPAGKYVAHALYSRGWSELKAERLEAALSAFRDFLEKFPRHELAPESRLKMAETLRKLKRYDEAVAAYDKTVSGDGAFSADAAIGRAWALYEDKKMAAAAKAFDKAAQALGKDERAGVCLFNAGNALVESGDFEGAAGLFARLTDGFTGHDLAPTAGYWRGYCLTQLKRFDAAVPILEGVLKGGKLDEKAVELRHALAEARMGAGQYRPAAEAYESVCKTAPQHELADEAAYGRMLALGKADDLEAAEEAGRAFFGSYEQSEIAPLARFALAEYRFRLKKYAEAASTFEALLAAKPKEDLVDDAHYKIGWCAMHLGDARKSQKHFALSARMNASPLAAESAFMAGRAAEQFGDTKKAGVHYEACARGWPKTEYAQRAGLALAFLDIGNKQFEKALSRADAFLKEHPDSDLASYAHLYRGEALLELGRLDDSLAAYAKVPTEGEGAALDAAYGMAWAHRKAGRHEAAAEVFGRVAGSSSDKAVDAAFWTGRSLEDAGQLEEAAGRYKAFVANHAASPHTDEAAYRRALCLLNSKQLQQARKLYAAYLEQRPKSALIDQARYDLAWVHLENKDADAARAVLEELLKLHPDSKLAADVAFRLGEMAYDEEDYTAAGKWYESALQREGMTFADKVLYKLGWSRDRRGETEEAAATFARIPREHDSSELATEANYHAGRLLQKLKCLEEARTAYAEVASGPFAEKALFQTAECWRAEDRHKEALEAYGKLLADFPETEFINQANLGRGHSCRAVGAFQDALEAYRAVVKATDTVDAASALLGEGYTHFAQDNHKDAAKAFLKVDILYGYDALKPEALAMLSSTWEKAGNAEKAEKYRKELRSRYPDSDFAKE
jgi:TolA-binding protein